MKNLPDQEGWHGGTYLLIELNNRDVTQKSITGHAMADHLAENPIDRYQPNTNIFLVESILSETEEEHPNWGMLRSSKYSRQRNRSHLISLVGAHLLVAVKLRFTSQITWLNKVMVQRSVGVA